MNTSKSLSNALLLGFSLMVSGGASAESVHLVAMLGNDVDRASLEPLPKATLKRLERLAGVSLSWTGNTRTHARILTINKPVSIDEARRLSARIAQGQGILWADVEDGPTKKPAAQSPGGETPDILEFVVKLSADDLTLNPDVRLIERLSNAVGQSVRFLRNTTTARVFGLQNAVTQSQSDLIEQQLESLPEVAYADPVRWIKHQSIVPNDPYFYGQWHLYDGVTSAGGANVQAAWNLSQGKRSIGIAVIDTGALFSHPDLKRGFGTQASKANKPGWDLITDTTRARDGDGRDPDATDEGDWSPAVCEGSIKTSPRASSWHGSHVAGIIGATTNNHQGIAGISFNARLIPVRVLGACGGSSDDMNDGIYWAAGRKDVPGTKPNRTPVDVINMSLGDDSPCSDSDQAAIDYALSRGITVMVSAGNSSVDIKDYTPAGCRGVIAVSSIGPTGDLAYYSNFGSTVPIAAPGGETRWAIYDESGAAIDSKRILEFGINSTVNLSLERPDPKAMGYAWYQGTSMASPVVAGTVSLMLSKDRHHQLNPAKIKSILTSTARDFPQTTTRLVKNSITGTVEDKETISRCQSTLKGLCGAGILDAERAVKSVTAINQRP